MTTEAQGTPPSGIPPQAPTSTEQASAAAPDAADWRAKFEAQQQASQALEAKLNQLSDGLKTALGTGDQKASTEDLVVSLQQQLATLQHANLVSELARRHAITDADDIVLLSAQHDADAMEKLAARLTAPRGDDPSRAGGPPRPDPSQGSRGAPAPLNSDALADALRSKLGIR